MADTCGTDQTPRAQHACIRLATPCDAEDILRIYTPYITDTPITFETCLPSPDEFRARIAALTATYPWLVAEQDAQVVGYAYADAASPRGAWQWSAEFSVYVGGAHTGNGTGKILCNALFSLLELQGIRSVLSRVTLPNPPSEKLHAALGFTPVGIWRAAGFKCGQWHDVAAFQKILDADPSAPAPLIPVTSLENEAVGTVLASASAAAADQNSNADGAWSSPVSGGGISSEKAWQTS